MGGSSSLLKKKEQAEQTLEAIVYITGTGKDVKRKKKNTLAISELDTDFSTPSEPIEILPSIT